MLRWVMIWLSDFPSAEVISPLWFLKLQGRISIASNARMTVTGKGAKENRLAQANPLFENESYRGSEARALWVMIRIYNAHVGTRQTGENPWDLKFP